VVLIENLRRLAERVAAEQGGTASRQPLHRPARGLSARAASTRCWHCSTGAASARRSWRRWRSACRIPRVEAEHAALEWLRRVAPHLAEIQTRLPAAQAADNLSTGNAITSLRSIGDADWPDIVGQTSVLMQLMLQSPAFAAERDDTRDRTLHALEKLAKKSGESERAVAGKLLELMHGSEAEVAAGEDDPKSVAAYWLFGPRAGPPAADDRPARIARPAAPGPAAPLRLDPLSRRDGAGHRRNRRLAAAAAQRRARLRASRRGSGRSPPS
jgi:cyclic beta-1,2-glucan synthetase